MKGYRFITDDDTSDFCHRVTEALSNGWTLHGEPKMTYDNEKKIMRCGQPPEECPARIIFLKPLLDN